MTFCFFPPAATLPGHIRQSQIGAEVAGLVPVYMKHLMPDTLQPNDHALNSKRLLWAAYDRMLASLIPERTDDADSVFVDGFRFVHALCIRSCVCNMLPVSFQSCLLPTWRCMYSLLMDCFCRFVTTCDVKFNTGRTIASAKVFTCFFVLLGG